MFILSICTVVLISQKGKYENARLKYAWIGVSKHEEAPIVQFA